MSTSVLIFIAVFTAISAIGALSYIRWREQQRLARARLMIELSDQILLQHDAAAILKPWLSGNGLGTIADLIQAAYRKALALKLPLNNKVKKASSEASEWLENPSMQGNPPLPHDERQAKNIRRALQQEIELIKEHYRNRRIDGSKASALLRELRLLNVRLVVNVLMSKANAALSMNNVSVAESNLTKVVKTIKAIKEPSKELASFRQRAELMLKELKSAQPQTNEPNRLAEAADQMAEEDEAWKKKHY